MQQGSFSKQFACQFRQGWIYHPAAKEESFEQLRFRRYGGLADEVPSIGYEILEKMSDASAITEIQHALTQKAIPSSLTVAWVARGICDGFQSYVDTEPASANLIAELLNNVKPFSILVYFCQKQMESLKDKLNWVLVSEMMQEERELFYRHLEKIIDEIALCKNEIDVFYHYFYEWLNQKTDQVRRIKLDSQLDLYLLQLVTYLESVISSIDEVLLLWEGWRLIRLVLEKQEIYN